MSGLWAAFSGLSESDATVVVAVLAAVFAAIGYVGKLIAEALKASAELRNSRRAKLVELDSLLRASRAVYEVQNELAIRLSRSIAQHQGEIERSQGGGYEDIFVAAFDGLNSGERELHGMIRTMTELAMRPLNERMLAWLQADTYYKARRAERGVIGDVAQGLAELEAHLYLWTAKYAYWMREPRHALVYLADESKHGIGYPHGLDAAVTKLSMGRH